MDNNFATDGIYPITVEEERAMKRKAFEEAREKAEIEGAKKNGIMLIPTLIYGLVATFCIYDNLSGILMPLFAIVTVVYVRFLHSQLRPEAKAKKGYILFAIGMMLLSIADTYTARGELIIYNNLMMFVLIVGLVLYLFMSQSGWTLTKYAAVYAESVIGAIGAISDMFVDTKAALKFNKNEKTRTLAYCLIGVAIFIPLGAVVISLLCSADLVFNNILSEMFENVNFATAAGVICTFIAVVIFSYCGIRYVDSNKISEEVKDNRKFPVAVANTVLTLIGLVYLMFSVVQIGSVFMGRMTLPDGYTYSEYIHEGFNQLLVVCCINVGIVLITKGFFKSHISTKLLLLVVSICTYIMIASAAIRLAMYVSAYCLTTLRIEVAWALVMIGISMAFITVSIFIEDMKLMNLLMGTAVVGLFVLSMIRPDALAVKYNLENSTSNDYEYVIHMSADALPYVMEIDDWDDPSYAIEYNLKVTEDLEEHEGLRKFNFSRDRAHYYMYY